jgi:hypothetical protein
MAKAPAIPTHEKQAIIRACDAFISDVLKPRYLPAVTVTEWNYPVDLRGAWQGSRYRFIVRYRSGFPENNGEEFDAPWARFDRVARDRFDIKWMRHTGAWWPLYHGVTLGQALELLGSDGVLRPPI